MQKRFVKSIDKIIIAEKGKKKKGFEKSNVAQKRKSYFVYYSNLKKRINEIII